MLLVQQELRKYIKPMRILIILLFVSFNSLGQTYDEIMSVKDLNSFKRVMIENNFQYDSERSDNEKGTYYYETMTDDNGGLYVKLDNGESFVFYYDKISDAGVEFTNTPYDRIFTEVKDRCTYYGIITTYPSNIDYASYECDEAQYIGYIGFNTREGFGEIKQVNE